MIYSFDDLEFKIISIDRFVHKPGVYNIKSRPFAVLSFRMSGEGRFEVDGKNFIARPGDIMFMASDLPYKVEYSSSESIVVHMRDCNYHEAEGICVKNTRGVELLFQKLLAEWNDGHSINKAK